MGQRIDLSFQVQGILPLANLPNVVSGLHFSDNETPAGTIDGVNSTFTLAQAPSPAFSLQLFKSPPGGGGASLLVQTIDYTLAGAQINTTAPPVSGSNLRAWYRWNQQSWSVAFEIMTMADSVATRFTTLQAYSDQMTLTDSLSFVLRPAQGLFTEKLYVLDATLVVLGIPKKLSDTVTLSDAFAKLLV